MMDAKSGYTDWHKTLFGEKESENLLPISEDKVKCYLTDLYRIGYAPNTIMSIHLTGLGIWVRECYNYHI